MFINLGQRYPPFVEIVNNLKNKQLACSRSWFLIQYEELSKLPCLDYFQEVEKLLKFEEDLVQKCFGN
jgi:hypothetical protein